MPFKKLLRHLDWPLLVATLLLLGLGLLILFAINAKNPALAQDFSIFRQLIYALIGLAVLVWLARTDYRIWRRYSPYWYIGGLALLLLVLAVGKTVLGATRALDIGLIQFQPTEFMKLALILALAGWFAGRGERLRSWGNLALTVLLLLVPALLVAVQPDLGSAILIGLVWGAMIWMSHVNKLQLAALTLGALLVIPLGVHLLHPYQRERLATFLHPTADPQGAGYNVVQATIAVGSGGLFGRGVSGGTQSQLNFLPSQHTDFVFAVIAEKLGFLGGLIVLGLFAVVITRAFYIGLRAADYFGSLIAYGIAVLFLVHAVINIGMNLGLAPVTGIPLPFLSYGGTNLIVSLAAIGLLQSIRVYHSDLEFKK